MNFILAVFVPGHIEEHNNYQRSDNQNKYRYHDVPDIGVFSYPVAEPDFSDDVISGNEPAGMRIVAVVAVITEHEVLPGRYHTWRHIIIRDFVQIWFAQGTAVDKNHFIADLDGVAWQADDPFYKTGWMLCKEQVERRFYPVARSIKDDIILPGRHVSKIISELIDDDQVPFSIGGEHRYIENLETFNGYLQAQEDYYCY
jgi:hypothetical protein